MAGIEIGGNAKFTTAQILVTDGTTSSSSSSSGSSSSSSSQSTALGQNVVVAGQSNRVVHFQNMDATNLIYIGPSAAVTSANGFPIGVGAYFNMTAGRQGVWAICGSGKTATLAVMSETV